MEIILVLFKSLKSKTIMYTVITPSKNQVDQIFRKHLKPFFGLPKVIRKSFSYDQQTNTSYVTLYTITGKKIFYQLQTFIYRNDWFWKYKIRCFSCRKL